MRWLKIIFSVVWLGLVVLATWAWLRSGAEFDDVPEILSGWLREFGMLRAALIYIALFILRPLVLFPAALLAMASGLLFGPWLGTLFTAIGQNASANAAFLLARWFGREWVGAREHGAVLRWEERVRENALVSVLVMRLVYLPFDAVNYGCGLTSMRLRDFFVGTAIGIIPGTVTFVLLGGSVSASAENRVLIFAGALLFFVLGLGVARILKRRESTQGLVAGMKEAGGAEGVDGMKAE